MYKELLRNQVTDTQFQIECLSDELVEMLMRRYGWDMKKALDELYSLLVSRQLVYFQLNPNDRFGLMAKSVSQ